MTEKPLKKELQLITPEVKDDILHIKQKQDNGQKQKKNSSQELKYMIETI